MACQSTTRQSGDKGIDIWLRDPQGKRWGVQCKRYYRPIGAKEIREFIGALANAKVKAGLFVTTSTFTEAAKKAAREAAHNAQIQVQLVDGATLGRLRNRVLGQEPAFLPWRWWRILHLWQKALLLLMAYLLLGLLFSWAVLLWTNRL